MKKIALLIFLLVIAAGLYVWVFVYNKPHTDFEQSKPEYVITAKKLFNDFTTNSKVDYTGKVVQISGTAQQIEDADTSVIVVFVFNEGMFGSEGIRCSFIPKYNGQLRKIKFPSPLTLKGFCPGYNGTDVIMEHCSLITNSK